MEYRPIICDIRLHEHAVLGNVYRSVFQEPYMPVYAGPFVEPSFILARVHADYNHVFLAVPHIICYVVAELGITAQIGPQVMSVQPDARIPEYTVELNCLPFPLVRLGYEKRPPVPPYRCLGKHPADRLVSVILDIVVLDIHERKLGHPVVRKVYQTPGAVIEIGLNRTH